MESTPIIKMAQNYGKICRKHNVTSLNSNLPSLFEIFVTICLCVALKVEQIAKHCGIDTDHQNGSKLREHLQETQCYVPAFESAVIF